MQLLYWFYITSFVRFLQLVSINFVCSIINLLKMTCCLSLGICSVARFFCV